MENIKNDFEEIAKLLELGENGYAKIYIKYNKLELVVLNIKKGIGYMYDEKTKLYKDLCQNSMINNISNTLQETIELIIKEYERLKEWTVKNTMLDSEMKKQLNKAYDTKLNSLKSKLAQLGNKRSVDAIYNFILEKFYKPELVAKFDTAENFIPVTSGKVINLLNGCVEDRTSKHYFTYEYKHKYIGKEKALTPLTNDFFMKISCNDPVKSDFLRLVIGSSITTDTKMKCFLFLLARVTMQNQHYYQFMEKHSPECMRR
jgi:hypothetical protein